MRSVVFTTIELYCCHATETESINICVIVINYLKSENVSMMSGFLESIYSCPSSYRSISSINSQLVLGLQCRFTFFQILFPLCGFYTTMYFNYHPWMEGFLTLPESNAATRRALSLSFALSLSRSHSLSI